MTFGEIIKRKRKRLGYTQLDLAEKLNVSILKLSTWESDEALPSDEQLALMAEILECDIKELTGESLEIKQEQAIDLASVEVSPILETPIYEEPKVENHSFFEEVKIETEKENNTILEETKVEDEIIHVEPKVEDNTLEEVTIEDKQETIIPEEPKLEAKPIVEESKTDDSIISEEIKVEEPVVSKVKPSSNEDSRYTCCKCGVKCDASGITRIHFKWNFENKAIYVCKSCGKALEKEIIRKVNIEHARYVKGITDRRKKALITQAIILFVTFLLILIFGISGVGIAALIIGLLGAFFSMLVASLIFNNTPMIESWKELVASAKEYEEHLDSSVRKHSFNPYAFLVVITFPLLLFLSVFLYPLSLFLSFDEDYPMTERKKYETNVRNDMYYTLYLKSKNINK